MTLLKVRKGAGNVAAPTTSGLESEKIEYYAERESGRANIDFVHLNDIRMDEDNPRTKGVDVMPLLKIIPDFLVIDPKHKDYNLAEVEAFDALMDERVQDICKGNSKLEKLFGKLIPLRDNIRLLGVLQPIEVLKEGREKFKIRYGHRRFIASILAGEKGIFSRVISKSNGDDKITQMSENAHQEKLGLHDRLQSLVLSLQESGVDASKARAGKVAVMFGLNRTLVQYYLIILKNASDKLMAAIESGVVVKLIEASKLAQMSEAECNKELLRLEGSEPVEVDSAEKKKKKVGRQRKFISTPNVSEPRIFLNIMDKFGINISDIDASDLTSVHEKWVEFIKSLEKECQRKG
ncbi:MAG: ParB N-terminal domain-containing protein [Kofleriaceae bacterium]|nr:ParB N-terminal domain-containing protein [Kofleriaceae bacterium]